MRKLVLGLGEGALEVLEGVPLFPNSQSPVSNDRRMGFKSGVESATGAISSEEGKDRVATSSRRGSSHGHLDPGLMKAGVRHSKGLASIHNRRDSGSARHESGVDASFPEGLVPVDATVEASEPLPETSSGSATTSHSISAKKLRERGS